MNPHDEVYYGKKGKPMNIEQIQAAMDQNAVDKQHAVTAMENITKEGKKLLKQKRELEEVKLRHGDYGKNYNGIPFIIKDETVHWLREKDIGQGTSELPNTTIKPKQVMGNLADDLQALSESLEEFTTIDPDGDTVKVYIATGEVEAIGIDIQEGEGLACVNLTLAQAKDFSMKFRQVIHTLEQK